MRLQTSFYMNIVVLNKLFYASKCTGKSVHDLIIEAMYNYAKDYKKRGVALGTVSYQANDKNENWRIFRIALKEKDYELFTDMRKVMKKSVSFLVALAVKKYLDEIVDKILKEIINYTYLTYSSGGKESGRAIQWFFNWLFRNKTPKRE